MRMRKKKNLDERIIKCKDNLISLYSEDRNFKTANEVKEYLDFKEIFGNENPVHLEIGCGKGQFVCEIAKLNPNINYIAVERNSNVIVQACEKSTNANLTNVRFIKCTAEYLAKYFCPQSIERIYLNFSCPFPKNKYAVHRLTSTAFLPIYLEIMAKNAEIHQKTDNQKLFEFSIEQLSNFGFTLKNISLDLHHSNFEGNIVTEYEKRFVDLGQPIYRLEAFVK